MNKTELQELLDLTREFLGKDESEDQSLEDILNAEKAYNNYNKVVEYKDNIILINSYLRKLEEKKQNLIFKISKLTEDEKYF